MLRNADWINLIYFGFMTGVAAWLPLPRRRRFGVRAFAAAGLLATLAGAFSWVILPGDWSDVLRDWLPVPIILFAYWQAGQLYTGPSEALQNQLQRIDDWVAGKLARLAPVAESPWFARYLEVIYVLAYPLVPLGLAALYLAGFRMQADEFWSVVLPASYLCYGILPLAPTLPPRLVGRLGADMLAADARRRKEGRRLNLWILDRLGIGANTFPSGHVAATTAASLAVAGHLPIVGALFLWISASIAVSVVVRRYHYLADAVLAAVVALVVWWVVV